MTAFLLNAMANAIGSIIAVSFTFWFICWRRSRRLSELLNATASKIDKLLADAASRTVQTSRWDTQLGEFLPAILNEIESVDEGFLRVNLRTSKKLKDIDQRVLSLQKYVGHEHPLNIIFQAGGEPASSDFIKLKEEAAFLREAATQIGVTSYL
jgi:hypothetical protein